MTKQIGHGAEAVIFRKNKAVIKDRVEKTYRHPILDEKIRKIRTRTEAKLLEKAYKLIPVPKIIKSDEIKKTIELEFINGKKLADNLEKLNYQTICKQIGKSLAKLHDNSIIHGDLTTSNLLYVDYSKIKKSNLRNKKSQSENHNINKKLEKVYFIDFGLGFQSSKKEDKAVDLHLIKRALEAKHSSIHEQAFKAILQGYKSSKNYSQTLKQLEAVEKRGRYKAQY